MGMDIPFGLEADTVFINGQVLTVDEDNSIASAVAVKDNKIIRVGSDDHVKEVIGENTKVIDLEGKTLLPGMNDSHTHPGAYGVFWVRGVQCGPDIETIRELLERVAEKAKNTPKGRWILGYKFDNIKLGRYPTLEELDSVTPDNPFYIQRRDGHIGVANSLALKAGGVNKDTQDPPHGKIDRDENGEPTGVLRETAKDLVYHKMPEYTEEEFYEGLIHVFEEYNSFGLTSTHASMTYKEEFKAMQRMKRDGVLNMRIGVHGSGRDEGLLESFITAGIQTPYGDDWVKITCVEWVFDTSTSGRTAAYYKPYVGEPDNYGILAYTQEDIEDRVMRAHMAGIRVSLDGIGDRGIDAALDAIEKALKSKPWPDHRHRIEHCCHVTPEIQNRLIELGVMDCSASVFVHELSDAYMDHRWPEEMRWMWPHRTLIDKGLIVPGHSDSPVCTANPWVSIDGLVTRTSKNGVLMTPEEAITPMEAIRAYTIDGAYAAFEEDIKGSIEVGKYADLVIVDRDPLTIDPHDLKNVKTLLTMIDGRVVYEA